MSTGPADELDTPRPRYGSVGVLAARYRGGRASLRVLRTHLVELTREGAISRSLDARYSVDALADDWQAIRPTCARCAARWDRIQALAALGGPASRLI